MADREVQRRLAAFLVVDVAGYTRLMEEDTNGTVSCIGVIIVNDQSWGGWSKQCGSLKLNGFNRGSGSSDGR